MRNPTTKDQKFIVVDGHLRAEIDVDITEERVNSPAIAVCRHAVLAIKTKTTEGKDSTGYVVYDRLLCRIVNGVWQSLEGAIGSAQAYNESMDSPQDMSPNGYALGLIYPTEWDSKGESK